MDVGPERKAGGAPAGSAQGADRRRNMILAGIGLGLLFRLLRSRRFYAYVITIIIVLITGSRAAKENQSRSMERLIEWNKRQTNRLEHKVKQALPG